MLKFIGSAIGALILGGFALALLITFDWSVSAILTWGWTTLTGLVDWIADWFINSGWFKNLVGH